MASLNLEVGIDAAGVVKGSKDAFSALVQLTNATRHLMDGLEAMNGANGAMGKFGMLMSRASPYIMAATAAMGAISLAMNVFSGNTDKASGSIQRQASAVDGLIKRFAELDIRRGYGAGDPRSSTGGAVDALTALRTSDRNTFTPGDAAGLFGVSEQQFRQALGEDALTLSNQRGRFSDRFQRASDGSIIGVAGNGFAMTSFDRSQVITAGERLLQQRRQLSSGDYGAPLPPGGLPSEPGAYSGMGPYLPGTSEDAMTRAGAGHWQNAQALKAQEDATRRQLEAMRELDQTAQQVGSTLGDAATRFVFQLSSGREILAGLVMQMAQAGLTQAATAGVRGIFNAFNAPAAQRTPGVNPT